MKVFAGSYDVLEHQPFRRLWSAQSVSATGSRVASIALVIFLATEMRDPTAVGLVLAAYAAPLVMIVPLAGVVGDRLARQRVIAVADCSRCALQATTAVLILEGRASVGILVVVGALLGGAEAFARPACTALVPQTVPGPLLQRANALMTASCNAADLLGPPLAAALVTTIGAGYAFALDAATFAASAALMALVRPLTDSPLTERGPLAAELREGLHEARTRPWVRLMLILAAGLLVSGIAPWMVLGPIAAADAYGSPSVFGLLAGAVGVGSVAGALVGMRARPRDLVLGAIAGTSAWPLLLALLAAQTPWVIVGCAAALAGAGLSLANVWWVTALGEQIPARTLARVCAWDWLASLGLLPLGYALVGPLAGVLGIGTTLALGATLSALMTGGALVACQLQRAALVSGPLEPARGARR